MPESGSVAQRMARMEAQLEGVRAAFERLESVVLRVDADVRSQGQSDAVSAERLGDVLDRMTRLEHAVMGNGKPGLRQELQAVSATVADHGRHLKSWRAGMVKLLGWIVGPILGILAARAISG